MTENFRNFHWTIFILVVQKVGVWNLLKRCSRNILAHLFPQYLGEVLWRESFIYSTIFIILFLQSREKYPAPPYQKIRWNVNLGFDRGISPVMI